MVFLRLSLSALLPVLISGVFYLLEHKTRFGKKSYGYKQAVIGIVFGLAAVFGTEFGVDVGGATANARDAAVLCAGLLFGGPAGIIAGVIGGAERWLAALWGAGEFSRMACSLATVLSGVYAALLRKYMFDGHRPPFGIGFAVGVVMEVLHLTILFLTNLSNADAAFEIVKICTMPMVLCNAFSVMCAVLLVSFLSRRGGKKKHKRNISQQVQISLLVCVILAYFATTAFVYSLQTKLAYKEAEELLRQSVADTRSDIERLSDAQILATARAVASAYNADGDADLTALCGRYGIDDIYVVDEEGMVVQSTQPDILGYDMSSGNQSGAFLELLTENGPEEMAQAYGPISFDGTYQKLAGVRLPSGGFLQVALGTEAFQDNLAFLMSDATGNRHMGTAGFLIIAEGDGTVVSNRADKPAPDVSLSALFNSQKRGAVFSAALYGEKSYCMYTAAEGYYILAVLPFSEVFEARDMSAYVNSFMEVIVFAVLFALIYFLVKRLVVNNIRTVNQKLGRIIDGDLDVVVDVQSSAEFSSLSADINSTVATLKRLIGEAASRIDRELEFARNIQHAALPSIFPAFPDRKEFDIYAAMYTAREVGGDFYDFFLLGGDRLGFLVADVSGKGIPAAMFMMTAKTLIKNLAESGLSPEAVMRRANDKLCEGNEAGMFVTAWFAVVDLATGQMTYVNAGHNPPLLAKGGAFEYLRSRPGLVLAGMEGFPYRAAALTLLPGDRIFLYTDGVTEAADTQNRLFGEERLRSCLSAAADRPLPDLLNAVKSEIAAFTTGAEQFDDITMLGFTYLGPQEDKQ